MLWRYRLLEVLSSVSPSAYWIGEVRAADCCVVLARMSACV